MVLLNAFLGAINQGILWSIMALGVYITFRLLNIADLTVDGSFASGGAVAAIILYNGGDPIVAVIVAIIAGCLAGFITGFLLTKCHIPAILAGILTQIGLYSINLRIMKGAANIPLLGTKTLYDWSVQFNLTTTQASIIVGAVIVAIVMILLYWFFGTELGASIRATGNNEQMVRAVGVNTDFTKIIGCTLSNGLIALSGALVAQQQGYADVKMGIGAIVIALASIVIGEVIFSGKGNFFIALLSILVGSIIYRIVIALVLQMGLSTDDLKLLTAIVVGIALSVPYFVSSKKQINMYKKLTKEVDENADN